jgi:uncharacterized protein (TIGR02466 family)
VKRIEGWFTTFIHTAPLRPRWQALNRDLLVECRQLREIDAQGQKWSLKNYPGGYTSYGSLDRLHEFSSTFMELRDQLDRHVKGYVKALDWDLGGRPLAMTDCWVNIMPHRTAHSLHLHPNSVISGTYYVATPKGCAGLKFEDPRLSRFMAAPPLVENPRPASRRYVTYPASAGHVILFESWLRHEVVANPVKAERISISFNFGWG